MEALPTKEEVLATINKACDEKDFEKAAKIILYYSLCKAGPEKFAKRMLDAVEKYKRGELKLESSR